jgi:hypothetical protein
VCTALLPNPRLRIKDNFIFHGFGYRTSICPSHNNL